MIVGQYKAQTVHLYVKDNTFSIHEYIAKIHYPTQSAFIIAQAAYERFATCYDWRNPVRALTITASSLQDADKPEQLDMFGEYLLYDRQNRLDRAVDDLRNRFGKNIVGNGSLYVRASSLATDKCESVKMPGMMYR